MKQHLDLIDFMKKLQKKVFISQDQFRQIFLNKQAWEGLEYDEVHLFYVYRTHNILCLNISHSIFKIAASLKYFTCFHCFNCLYYLYNHFYRYFRVIMIMIFINLVYLIECYFYNLLILILYNQPLTIILDQSIYYLEFPKEILN